MKIQCGCGAKYSFDVTPEMAAAPIAFVCQACGADNSDLLNQLICQQFPTPPPPANTARSAGSVPVAIPLPASPPPTAAPSGQPPAVRRVVRGQGQHQSAVIQARPGRKARRIGAAVAVLFAFLVGFWFWYEVFGSKPSVAYSLKFPAAVYAGHCKLVPPHDALLLRGGRLARYDWAARKEVWSNNLVDRRQIEESAARFMAQTEAENRRVSARMQAEGLAWKPESPGLEETTRRIEDEAAAQIHWHINGHDVWLALPGKLARYDWQTGKVSQEISLPGTLDLFIPGETAILAVARSALGRQIALRIGLPAGDVQQQELTVPSVGRSVKGASAAARSPMSAGPQSAAATVAQAARAIQTPAARAGSDADVEARPADYSRSAIVAGGRSLMQLTVDLIEARRATVQAMKEAPKKSALEGEINASATAAIANEILNDLQREDTGGVEQEDISRYRVTLKGLFSEETAEWIGEVVGPPELFPLQTVNVLIAGKNVIVFDKINKKLWESKLAYPVADGRAVGDELCPVDGPEDFVPCEERGGTLFLFDQGMLTAFELATGNARWRLPSVGISRLLFDGQGQLYVNTSDADQERIKYSQQIDLEAKSHPVILKVDPRSGKILWRARNYGRAATVTGKFVYAVEWAAGDDHARLRPSVIPAHLRIYALDPKDGKPFWEHYDGREPIALDFHQNLMQVLFKKEMQLLKFVSF